MILQQPSSRAQISYRLHQLLGNTWMLSKGLQAKLEKPSMQLANPGRLIAVKRQKNMHGRALCAIMQ